MAAGAVRGGLCGAKLARLVLGSRTASTGTPAAPTPDGQRQPEQQGKLTRVWQSEGIRHFTRKPEGLEVRLIIPQERGGESAVKIYVAGQHPRLDRGGEVAEYRNIVLSNPGKRNALSLSMLKSLRQDILQDIDSTDLRVIIISAEGPVFSSGHDLKELTPKEDTKQHMDIFKTCSEVMTLLPKLPVPVIAKVNGLATAAGCQLVASCDIAVASEKSKFATPGVNVGLFCSTPGVAIGRSLPKKVALELLFTGVPMTAQDALLHGLISRVVPEDQLENETLKIAQKICQSSRAVLALGKATFYNQMECDISTAYQIASQVMVENLAMKDGQEGIEAFVSKRKPNWFHS